MDVRIENFPDQVALARMCRGPYPQSAPAAWVEVNGFANETGLRSKITAAIGFGLDSPMLTPPAMLRYVACLTLDKADMPAALPDHIHMRRVPGGRYAVYRMQGPYDRMPERFVEMHNVWAPKAGVVLDYTRPFLEIYLNDPATNAPADYLTDLCLPIRENQDEPVDELAGA